MPFTEEQLKTVEAWWSRSARSSCAWCNSAAGYKALDLVKLTIVNGRPASLGIVLMRCDACGHVASFSADVVGLLPPAS